MKKYKKILKDILKKKEWIIEDVGREKFKQGRKEYE